MEASTSAGASSREIAPALSSSQEGQTLTEARLPPLVPSASQVETDGLRTTNEPKDATKYEPSPPQPTRPTPGLPNTPGARYGGSSAAAEWGFIASSPDVTSSNRAVGPTSINSSPLPQSDPFDPQDPAYQTRTPTFFESQLHVQTSATRVARLEKTTAAATGNSPKLDSSLHHYVDSSPLREYPNPRQRYAAGGGKLVDDVVSFAAAESTASAAQAVEGVCEDGAQKVESEEYAPSRVGEEIISRQPNLIALSSDLIEEPIVAPQAIATPRELYLQHAPDTVVTSSSAVPTQQGLGRGLYLSRTAALFGRERRLRNPAMGRSFPIGRNGVKVDRVASTASGGAKNRRGSILSLDAILRETRVDKESPPTQQAQPKKRDKFFGVWTKSKDKASKQPNPTPESSSLGLNRNGARFYQRWTKGDKDSNQPSRTALPALKVGGARFYRRWLKLSGRTADETPRHDSRASLLQGVTLPITDVIKTNDDKIKPSSQLNNELPGIFTKESGNDQHLTSQLAQSVPEVGEMEIADRPVLPSSLHEQHAAAENVVEEPSDGSGLMPTTIYKYNTVVEVRDSETMREAYAALKGEQYGNKGPLYDIPYVEAKPKESGHRPLHDAEEGVNNIFENLAFNGGVPSDVPISAIRKPRTQQSIANMAGYLPVDGQFVDPDGVQDVHRALHGIPAEAVMQESFSSQLLDTQKDVRQERLIEELEGMHNPRHVSFNTKYIGTFVANTDTESESGDQHTRLISTETFQDLAKGTEPVKMRSTSFIEQQSRKAAFGLTRLGSKPPSQRLAPEETWENRGNKDEEWHPGQLSDYAEESNPSPKRTDEGQDMRRIPKMLQRMQSTPVKATPGRSSLKDQKAESVKSLGGHSIPTGMTRSNSRVRVVSKGGSHYEPGVEEPAGLPSAPLPQINEAVEAEDDQALYKQHKAEQEAFEAQINQYKANVAREIENLAPAQRLILKQTETLEHRADQVKMRSSRVKIADGIRQWLDEWHLRTQEWQTADADTLKRRIQIKETTRFLLAKLKEANDIIAASDKEYFRLLEEVADVEKLMFSDEQKLPSSSPSRRARQPAHQAVPPPRGRVMAVMTRDETEPNGLRPLRLAAAYPSPRVNVRPAAVPAVAPAVVPAVAAAVPPPPPPPPAPVAVAVAAPRPERPRPTGPSSIADELNALFAAAGRPPPTEWLQMMAANPHLRPRIALPVFRPAPPRRRRGSPSPPRRRSPSPPRRRSPSPRRPSPPPRRFHPLPCENCAGPLIQSDYDKETCDLCDWKIPGWMMRRQAQVVWMLERDEREEREKEEREQQQQQQQNGGARGGAGGGAGGAGGGYQLEFFRADPGAGPAPRG